MHPRLAADPSGTIYMLALYGGPNPTRLGLFASHNGGDSFGEPVPVTDAGAEVISHGENSPSLAFGATEIYALWEQRREKGGTDLMFARSVNFGRSFESPIQVPDKADASPNIFSNLRVSPDGTVYAVWLDGRQAGPGTFSVYLARSTDRGASFEPNREVARSACPCCRPAIAFGPQEEVHIAWRKVFEGDIRDIVVSTSRDGGRSFDEPVRVAVDNWKIAGCPHSGPVLAAAGRRLYAAWFSEGSAGNSGIRISWSDDGGLAFARPLIISRGILDANHPALTVLQDGRVLVAFEGRPPSNGDNWESHQAFLAELGADGKVSGPVGIPSGGRSVSYPALSVDRGGRVFLGWTESGPQHAAVFLSRARTSR
jgi:hypothetical protein